MRHCTVERIRKPGLEQSLLRSLILHKKARTTLARAKKIRPIFERLVTKARKVNFNGTDVNKADSASLAAMRLLSSELSSWDLAAKLVKEVCPLVEGRPGGYTRILKIGQLRRGDSAKEAIISVVQPAGANDTLSPESTAKIDELLQSVITETEEVKTEDEVAVEEATETAETKAFIDEAVAAEATEE